MPGKSVTPYKDRLLPTTTVSQARLQIFQPTRRPTRCVREIETPWGTAKITGRLGVMHAALLEAIMFHSMAKRDIDTGGLQVLIDPYKIRVTLGSRGLPYSGTALQSLIEDLKTCALTLKIRDGGFVMDGLVDRVETSTMTAHNPVPGAPPRHLWRITLSPTAAELLNTDLPLHYDPRPIAALRSGVAAGVARWVLTHRAEPTGGWKMDTILLAIGAEISGPSGRQRRSELREASADLARIGIIITDEDRIFKRALSVCQGALSVCQGRCL